MGVFESTGINQTYSSSKRVHYTRGLVMGVDEFAQEQTHLVEEHRRHRRALHGHGTVSGLAVSVEDVSAGANIEFELRVEPGLAVSAAGQLICATERRCAKLNKWLKEASPVQRKFDVVLFYTEHCTDKESLPGEPCRTDEELTAHTRVESSFYIDLIPRDPAADGEGSYESSDGAAQEFGRVLRAIRPVLPGEKAVDVSEVESRARTLGTGAAAEDLSAPLPLPRADVPAAVRAAIRVWVTEVRPSLAPDGLGSGLGARFSLVRNAIRETQPGESEVTERDIEARVRSIAEQAPLDQLSAPLPVPTGTVDSQRSKARQVWQTKVRPDLAPGGLAKHASLPAYRAAPAGERANGVYLAQLSLEDTPITKLDQIRLSQDARPCLLPARLLQEWAPGVAGERFAPRVRLVVFGRFTVANGFTASPVGPQFPAQGPRFGSFTQDNSTTVSFEGYAYPSAGPPVRDYQVDVRCENADIAVQVEFVSDGIRLRFEPRGAAELPGARFQLAVREVSA